MMQFTEWGPELADALAEPFAPESHSTKTQGGSQITFVDVHEYKDRLNNTVGPQGWSSAVRMEAYGGKLIFVVALTILGVTKENVGDEVEEPPVNDRGNAKIIGSSCTNAYAQAFKRTCSDFGLGAYLYDKERREAATKPRPRATPRTEHQRLLDYIRTSGQQVENPELVARVRDEWSKAKDDIGTARALRAAIETALEAQTPAGVA